MPSNFSRSIDVDATPSRVFFDSLSVGDCLATTTVNRWLACAEDGLFEIAAGDYCIVENLSDERGRIVFVHMSGVRFSIYVGWLRLCIVQYFRSAGW